MSIAFSNECVKKSGKKLTLPQRLIFIWHGIGVKTITSLKGHEGHEVSGWHLLFETHNQ